MFNPSKSSLVEQITDAVGKLPEKQQKKVLYLVKLQQAAAIAGKLDKKGRRIKGKRPSMAEINSIVKGNRAKKRA